MNKKKKKGIKKRNVVDLFKILLPISFKTIFSIHFKLIFHN